MDANDVKFEHGVVRRWIKLNDSEKLVAILCGRDRS
jgi:hypothetical protein